MPAPSRLSVLVRAARAAAPLPVLVALVVGLSLPEPVVPTSTLGPADARVAASGTTSGDLLPDTLSVVWGPATRPVGELVVVAGSAPARPGAPVRLQTSALGLVWVDVAAGTVEPDGTFELVWPLLTAGATQLRVRVDGPLGLTALVSETRGLEVGLLAATLRAQVTDRGRVSARVAWRLDGPAQRRAVRLQRRSAHAGWRTVRTLRVAPGTGSIRIRPGSLGRYRYRLLAPATDRLAAAVSPVLRYALPTGYRPAGPASAHRPLFPHAARWDPCRVIGVRMNLRHAWPGARRDVREALRRTAWASGLRFEVRGRTRLLPHGMGPEDFPRDTDLVIAWARPGSTPLLPTSAVGRLGMGGAVAWSDRVDEQGRAAYELRQGRVVISTAAQGLPRGFGSGATRGALLLHELGHAVGLGHVEAPSQRMYGTIGAVRGPGSGRWGAGDLTGLQRLGAPQGCLRPAPWARASSGDRGEVGRPFSRDLP